MNTPFRVRVFPASAGDLDRLMAFYERERSDELPPPAVRDLGDTLYDGRTIVAEDLAGNLCACAAHVGLTPDQARTYVGELTGTRVTPRLNGARPLRFHTLLLGLRLLSHVATNIETPEDGTTSMITIISSSNVRSLKGIRAAGFVELKDRPSWLKFDELSWHGRQVEGEWIYFMATGDTVRRVASTLIAAGLFTWKMALENDRGPITVELDGFHDLRLAEADIRELAEGRYAVDWVPPPERIAM